MNAKFNDFKKNWDTEYIEISFDGKEGDFYPNERGLVILRKMLSETSDVNHIIVDGDFDERDNFDDEFYGFAHLDWNEDKWELKRFQYDPKTHVETSENE